jgi:glycosyltransferase involved in cell wall biosynthesis
MNYKKKINFLPFKIHIIFIILIISLELKIIGKNKKNAPSKLPKVSVFLPIYNKEKYLYRCINSIKSQSLKNIEIIAINDCSTDNSLKMLKKLSKNDNRIKIINNDRNYGLFYSRAKGIINSVGEYLINLDPDDKFKSNSDLKLLYNKARKSNLDYILYLLKRIPRHKSEIKSINLQNKLQLQNEDFYITNKFVKREILVKAYNYLYNDIHKNKWNYHEDNIWNILIRIYSKRNKTLNKYIYIYKRNGDSLNIKKDNSIFIKNSIYRAKTLIKIILNNNVTDSELYLEKYYQYFNHIYQIYNNSILKLNEIKNDLINISFNFLDIYYNRKDIVNDINYILNCISYNKIIIFFSSENQNINDKLTYISINKYLQENNERKIIFVNINNDNQVNIISNYIYYNDIFLGLGSIMFQYNFLKIIKKFNKNKIILLHCDVSSFILDNNITYNSSFNLFIYSIYKDYNGILNNKLYFVPNNILNLANYFNYINNIQKKKNVLTVFFENYNNEDIDSIENIINLKFEENETIFNLTELYNYRKNLTSIINIIRDSKIIITDNFIVMELSALSFTSCIIYGNLTQNNNLKIDLNLKYVKYINDINELKNKLNELGNQSKVYNEYDINMDFQSLNLELKI